MFHAEWEPMKFRIVPLLFCVFLSSPCASGDQVRFVADYSMEGANEGFNDPTLGASRRNAFAHALGIWESYLVASYAGQTVTVQAAFDPLGGTSEAATLGRASANGGAVVSRPTFAGTPLASQLRGFDTNGSTHDIKITFNSDIDNQTVLGPQDFYYGTDANPGFDTDFVTVALHEIAHGLDFSSDIKSDGTLRNATLSKVFDQFLTDSATGGTPLSGMTDAQRLTAITGDSLYWFGPSATAANGGNRVRMYAPSPYEKGSSVSHVDEGSHGELTLSPKYNNDIINHQISALELGMLEDMGWNITSVPEPSTALSLALGAVGFGFRRVRAAGRASPQNLR